MTHHEITLSYYENGEFYYGALVLGGWRCSEWFWIVQRIIDAKRIEAEKHR